MNAVSDIRKAIVLAGGRGERLKPRVSHLPKPMAPVNGRPFLEYILDRLAETHLREVILAIGYRGAIIREHFGHTYRSLHLGYSEETVPLGTGGAMALALKHEDPSPVLVLNGDSFLEMDYPAFFSWYGVNQPLVAMVVRQVPDVGRYGSVVLEGDQVIAFREKGKHGEGLASAGVYVIRPTLFSDNRFGRIFSFETDVLQRYGRKLRPRAYMAKGYFIDIGTPEDYDRAQLELAHVRRPMGERDLPGREG